MKARTLFAAAILLILIGSAFAYTDLSVDQVKAKIDAEEDLVLLDVREPSEFEGGHIRGAINHPWNSGVLQAQYGDLPTDKPIIVICRSGGRSAAASIFLDGQGFDQVFNMLGGMSAWTYETVTGEEEQEECVEESCLGVRSWGSIKALFRTVR